MPTREEIELRDRAEKALRAGRPAEALVGFGRLLARVHVFEAGVYEAWLEGALATYRALDRQREAGYILLALRRPKEAEACFSRATAPLDLCLALSMQGRHADSARVLAEADHPALAAFELEAAGDDAGARAEYQRLLAHPRLRGLRYETALGSFNLGELLLRTGDEQGAARAFEVTQTLLEALADEFETRGERERAFDCYGIVLKLGRDTGSFENVAEGYLNSIRILAADDQKFLVLQYYEDFLEVAVERGEWHAAATLAREAADYSLRSGLVYDRHFLRRAADLWMQAAAKHVAAGAPTDMAENALHAAIDASAALADMPAVGRAYAALSVLALPDKRRGRYAALAARYATTSADTLPTTAFPEHLKRPGAYQEVWRQDLVEWELDGAPAAVLARLVVERLDHVRFSRLALQALLQVCDPRAALGATEAAAEIARALGRIQVYEVLRPLERLYEHPSPEVRAAVMAGVSQVYCKRSFGLVRQGLSDPAAVVHKQALDALRALRFRDGFEPLVRVFRESREEDVRLAALETIAAIGSLEAGLFLIDVIRQEQGTLAASARAKLGRFAGEEIVPHLRRAADIETGDAALALRDALQALGRA